MRTYRIENSNIEIPKSEICDMKRRLKISTGKDEYSEVQKLVSNPDSVILVRMIPGTHFLQCLLNSCILFSRLGIVLLFILLFMQEWLWALGCVVLTIILAGPLQTNLNFEIAARVKILNRYLLDSKKDNTENRMFEGHLVEHPFFEDYINILQTYSNEELDADKQKEIREQKCRILPLGNIKKRWSGFEMSMPWPSDSSAKEILNQHQPEVDLFIRNFFERFETNRQYCNLDDGIEEELKKVLGKTTGVHYTLNVLHLTFVIRFKKWMDCNQELYNCSLVCELDEVLAKFSNDLQQTLFAVAPHIPSRRRREQKALKKMLRAFAPVLEKPLLKEIWDSSPKKKS